MRNAAKRHFDVAPLHAQAREGLFLVPSVQTGRPPLGEIGVIRELCARTAPVRSKLSAAVTTRAVGKEVMGTCQRTPTTPAAPAEV